MGAAPLSFLVLDQLKPGQANLADYLYNQYFCCPLKRWLWAYIAMLFRIFVKEIFNSQTVPRKVSGVSFVACAP
jgi:hypothetical protein